MKRTIGLLIVIWLKLGLIATVAEAQPRYGILPQQLCWRTAAGVDSSITGYTLIASQGAKQFLFYTDAYGQKVNYDTTGTLKYCYCSSRNTLRCFYAAEGGYSYVQEITLADGTDLSAQAGFNFPYAAVSDLAQLQADLETYLFSNDPCNTYVVTVQLGEDDKIQLMIEQTCLRFGNITFSNTSTGGGVGIAFSENCNMGDAPQILDVGACYQVACNPFSPPPIGPAYILPFNCYISGTGITGADITLTFNGDAAPFTYDPITGLVSGNSPYEVSSSCFNINPPFPYTWEITVTTSYGTDTYSCSASY